MAGCGSTSSGPPPVKIGALISVAAVGIPNFLAADEAAARDINAHGGIHGRPVQIENCDEHNDPNLAETCARKLVSDGVIATAGNLTPYGMVEAPILDEAGIPEVGGEALSPEEDALATCFPLDGGVADQIDGVAFAMKRRGLHSIYVEAWDTPAGIGEVALIKQAARMAGISYLGQQFFPEEATDVTPYLQAAIQANPDVVYSALPPEPTIQMFGPARAAGAKFLMGFVYGQLMPKQLDTLGGPDGVTENSVEFAVVPPLSAAAQFPALRTFQADMDAEYAAGDLAAVADMRTGGPILAWLAVQIIARLANQQPVADAASVLHALRTTHTVDTLGLTAPWSPGKNAPGPFPRATNTAGYFVSQRGGTEVLTEPTPFDPMQALGI